MKFKIPTSDITDSAVRYALVNGASAWRTDSRLSNYDEDNRRIMAFCRYLEQHPVEEIKLFHKHEKQIEAWPGGQNWRSWRRYRLREDDDYTDGFA